MGERVQRALEAYVVPRPLRGKDFGRGPVPKRITPIFRDRWDAGASTNLTETLRDALRASDALIVLCSAAAAGSSWVDQEIRGFKRAGRQDRVYAVLIDGVPQRFDRALNPRGAFPPALFERWDQESLQFKTVDDEPLAADARENGDGLRFTVLKLVAGLTNIPLTMLTERQAEAERRERNTARWIAGIMATLALSAAVGAWTSWRASVAARTRLENAVEMAASRVDDAARFRDRYGVPSKVIHELLNGAEQDFDKLTDDATPTLALQRARLTRVFAQHYESVGDNARHETMAKRAFDRLGDVPTRRRIVSPDTWLARLPTAGSVRTERIAAHEALGLAQVANGNPSGARVTFQVMARDADALVHEAGGANARILAANARSHLARLDYDSGRLEAALRGFGEAATVLATHPTPVEVAGELAKTRSDEAEMLLELGRHADALTRQRSAVEALEKIVTLSPESRRTLAVTLARRGDMRLAADRDLPGARADYVRAQSILAELLAADGARIDIKRDLSLAHERAGDGLLQAGDRAGAAEEFAVCLRLRRELVARDRSNPEWRRDLSVALERVGAVGSQLGRYAVARAALDEALSLRQAVFDSEPNDTVATRDLAILWMEIGRARAAARAPRSEVETAFEKALGLLAPLVDQAPPESRLRRDLAVAYAERGEARYRAGMRQGARSDAKSALHLITELRAVAPNDRQLAQDESWLRARLKR